MNSHSDKAGFHEASPSSTKGSTSPLHPHAAIETIIRDAKKLEFFRSLLHDCIQRHDACKMDRELQSTIRGLRVIDCTQRKVIAAPPECKYFALSYVWGKDQQPCVIDGCLPQTIEDSITTVLYLGYRYLWIDRFVRLQLVY